MGAALPPEVSRVLSVRNLPFRITGEEVCELFGQYGALRQVRLGTATKTKGSAFVVFHDVHDAMRAVSNLSGFKVGDRYIAVQYFRS